MILARLRQRYADFGPTLAAEYLAQEGFSMSRETLRKVVLARRSGIRRAWRSLIFSGWPQLLASDASVVSRATLSSGAVLVGSKRFAIACRPATCLFGRSPVKTLYTL